MEPGKKSLKQTPHEPIAIVGMSCRFPKAETLTDFWQLLHKGEDTIAEIPSDRWDLPLYFDPDPVAEHKSSQRHASFLPNIHDFDPLFFGISPAEAQEMNPSQKLMLELVWEAIENTSLSFEQLKGKKAGVYIGNIWSDFEHFRKEKNAKVTSHSAIGQSANIIANRVSFTYGFTGPSMVVDTGCSSSLVALNLACQSLWEGSTEMSVVGAVNHILDPYQYILLSKFGGLSASGKCNTFDDKADGFVRGEGGAIVLLKTLSAAQRDGDNIHAVIRGVAMNNNGFNVNLPATSVAAQKQMLQDAYGPSGILPHEVHYVEAHGTGTRVGDPTEARALGEFFRQGRDTSTLRIGSVKTNIGHLEAAAGMAGLIKVVLAMKHQLLPPSLNFNTPNAKIPFEDLRLEVQQRVTPWPAEKGQSLKAGVNSFGWGGTNAHVIIEQYKPETENQKTFHKKGRYCLPISAKTRDALKTYVKKYRERMASATEAEIKDICIASSLRKPLFTHRELFSGTTKEQLLQALDAFRDEPQLLQSSSVLTANDKVVMVFPGQGSQWLGMGNDLLKSEPVFREHIEYCDQVLQQFCNWSLLDQLKAGAEKSRLHEIDVIQPVLFAVQVSLAKLWISWGVRPHAVAGHSMGEVAAAYIAGALDLHDAARIICIRSRLMKTVSGKGGAMVVTELSYQDAEAILYRYPKCSIAVSNSPKSTVIAGDQNSIHQLILELEEKGLFCRQVNVDVASHSVQMEPLKQPLYEALAPVNAHPATIPFHSTVRDSILSGVELNAEYWVENLRNPVCFESVTQRLMDTQHKIFIEVSPHPVLSTPIQECAAESNKPVIVINSLHREKPEQEMLYAHLGELFAHGYAVNWNSFYETDKAPFVPLPGYPFQRERYALEIRPSGISGIKKNTEFPLAGNSLELADQDETFFWETEMSLESLPFLKDHQVNDQVIVPGAAYLEMVFEGAQQVYKTEMPSIVNLKFINAATLVPGEAATVQLKIKREVNSTIFGLYRKISDPRKKSGWQLLCHGDFKNKKTLATNILPSDFCDDTVLYSQEEYYTFLKSLGLNYGPYFKGVSQIRRSSGSKNQISFSVRTCNHISRGVENYKIHPALLDACLQPLFCSVAGEVPEAGPLTTFLGSIDEITFLASVDKGDELQGIATFYPSEKIPEKSLMLIRADIHLFSGTGKPLMIIRGATAKIINAHSLEDSAEAGMKNWLYGISWKKRQSRLSCMKNTETRSGTGTWLVFGDPYGISNHILNRMKAKQFHCVYITPGEGFAQLAEDHYTIAFGNKRHYEKVLNMVESFQGIIHMSSLNYAWKGTGVTAEQIESHQVYGSIGFLFLSQALSARKLARMPAITIVTNGVQAITNLDIAHPIHRPLWGLAKVMMNERSDWRIKYLDLHAEPSAGQMDDIVTELTSPHYEENEIAFRDGRYVPRLIMPADEEITAALHPKEFRSNVTYVITGYNGIAFEFIEWMISKGARYFALISRSGKVTGSMESRISALQETGCSLTVFSADVANYRELKKTFEKIEQSLPPLGGIVHAAGTIKANSLTHINAQELLHILSPKMKGAWNLHLLTQHKPLDCFILFSSASALIGLSGQGSYVAANAFLDGLAYMRRSLGLPALSANWGVISDSGMVANDPELERYAREEGFKPVTMPRAMEVFERIYSHNYTQIGIMKLDLARLSIYYSQLSSRRYFKSLLRTVRSSSGNNAQPVSGSLQHHLSREEKIASILECIIKEVSGVTRVSFERIKPIMTFKELGLDSIMAIQLRNKLEKIFNLKLSVGMFWNYPSVSEYSSFVFSLISENQTVKASEKAGEEPSSRWLVIPKPNPSAQCRIFCFHDAGGDSTLFSGWEDLLGNQFEVVAIEFPGRGQHLSPEKPLQLPELVLQLKKELHPHLNKPYFFFGHSMGGLVAFETARALRYERVRQPELILLSSVPALSTYSEHDIGFENLSLSILGRKPVEATLRKSVLSLLKRDLRMISNYHYRPDEPLTTGLIVIHGYEDHRVNDEQAKKWIEETSNSFRVITRPGGHRYIVEDGIFLTSLIRKAWVQKQKENLTGEESGAIAISVSTLN